ncbi:nucleotidyltransferase domain-containing protein [Cohnella sp. REN36]|nr:nucleotidyltransferase domain-containing protein [Cohnella sp. REN36]MCC3377415.1 nucleotidyltransferase domain-containing protein [Cohnella sp. REN36]
MNITLHERFIERIQPILMQDDRFVGLLAGGSMMQGEMDAYSDLDLIVVYKPEFRDEIMAQRLQIAEGLGHLLAAFTGEHVGEPRLIISLYGPAPLHVDFKFVTPAELESRIEDPVILWERTPEIGAILGRTQASQPQLDLQWIEDRFWVWVHYGAVKLGRGELFEVMDLIAYLRGTVLGPMILAGQGRPPRGVRKLEQHSPDAIPELVETVPAYGAESCYRALQASIRLYRRLRQPHSDKLTLREDAEQAAVNDLNRIFASLSNG